MANVYDLNGALLTASAPQGKTMDFGLAWINWANDLKREADTESDAVKYAKHDLLLTQRLDLHKLADSKPVFAAGTPEILARAKELHPKLRQFEYIQSESGRTDFIYNGDHAHLNADGSWEGSTAALSGCSRIYTYAQLCDWLDYFKATGADGVFWDDWGYDFAKEDICAQMGLRADDYEDLNAALNTKWTMLIDACHARGLSLITNGNFPHEVGDWYTHLDENDVIAMESCLISSDNYAWQAGQTKLYDYYANWYRTGNCKAKVWSLDYFPPDAEDIRTQVLTYLCGTALTCGAHYVSMGVGRCIEKPPFVEAFVAGQSKKIVQLDSNTYQLTVGSHTLESHRWKSLSGVVSANTANRNYFVYDGHPFIDGFTLAPVVDYKYGDRMTSLENIVENSTVDTRKNASSFWRMAIDDWQGRLSYLDYNNLLAGKLQLMPITGAAIERVINPDGTVDLVFTYSGGFAEGNPFIQVITANNYESLKLTGQGLEFGFADVTFEMAEGSWTLPNGTAWYGEAEWAYPTFRPYVRYTVDGEVKEIPWIKGTGSEIGVWNGHWEQTKTGTITAFDLCFWTRAPEGGNVTGKITFKNAYLVDLGEHSDEVLKTWYTNLFPTSYTVINQLGITQTASSHLNHTVYDVTVSTDNAWGWVFYQFDGDEVVARRGHTFEFGCMSLAFSNGATGRNDIDWRNFAFGVGLNSEDAPSTVRLYTDTKEKSAVWDTKMPCVSFTVPNTASRMILGYRSYGYDTGVTLNIEGAYLYDLDEAVDVRGKSSTNASLRLCRITEAKEAESPSGLRNALFITEKGRLYSTDLSGTKVEVAGAVYAGAVEAGYTGTADEFGAALAALVAAQKA